MQENNLNNRIDLYKNGFTLIEIMLVMLISVIIITISGDFIIKGFRSSTFGYEQDSAVNNARKALGLIAKEVRESNQAANGNYILDTVDEQEFSFYSDLDNDNLTEKIRYFLDGTTFKKSTIVATGTLLEYNSANEEINEICRYVENQANPIFTYYDQNNIQITDPGSHKSDIRLVHVNLKINVTPERAPNDYDVNIYVQIRNLKDNL